MNGVAAEGGARGSAARQWMEAIAEALRERRSERRARAAARLAAVPLRIRRATLTAALDARLAVRAGVRLDDFLRHRLARYASRLPVPLEALPVTVDVEGGEATIRRKTPPRSYGPRPENQPGAPGPLAPGGAWGARDLRDAEASLDALDGRTAEARARVDAAARDLASALASGEIVAYPAVEASPEQLGRPPVPSEAPVHGLRAFVLALLVAEGWHFSGPVLAASGLAAGEGGLEAALRSSLPAAGLALLLAAGGAAAAFTFAWFALARGAEALAAAGAPRRPLLVLASAGAAALVPGVAAAAAAPDRWAQLALLAVVPFAGAALLRAAAALAQTRAAAAAAALAWDRERAREAVARGRREEACQRAAEELRREEAAREDARRRLARLHRSALAHDRAAQLASRAEAERLDRLSESLACALELDRYLFVRFAAERAHLADRPARARVVEAGVGAERLGVAG